MNTYIMLNKPAGCVTACTDKEHPTVMRYVPVIDGLHPIGRLDIDTHGLLLLTDDGRATIALTDPEAHVEKEYLFYAFGELTEEKIGMLRNGVAIGKYRSKPAEAAVRKVLTVKDMQDYMSADKREHYMKNPHGKALCGTIKISEGRKHQVKLMLSAVGCKILYLKRIAIGDINLDSSLPEGGYRYLSAREKAYIEQRKRIYDALSQKKHNNRPQYMYEGEHGDQYCSCLEPES